jgi:hypothetical protein
MKNQFSNYALIFAAGFLLCFLIFLNKKNGARVESSTIKAEEAKIDSLVILERISETKIENHYIRRQTLKQKYEKDTSYINSTSFDSLVFIFSEQYPQNK